MNPVMRVSGEAQVFAGAGGSDLCLVEQIAPRVAGVSVAQNFLLPPSTDEIR